MTRPVLVAICFVACAVGGNWSPGSAKAEWLRYQDPRFGTSTLYPGDLLSDWVHTETGAMFSGAGGHLEISAAHQDVYSIQELRRLIAEAPGYERVTYSPQGRTWLVVSGYRGDGIFYEKYFVKDGIVEGFAIEYPSAMRHVFDRVVETVELLQAGPVVLSVIGIAACSERLLHLIAR